MKQKRDMSPEAVAITIAGSVGLSGNDLAVGLLEKSKDCVKLLSIDGHLDFMNCNGLLALEIDDTADVIGRLWWDLWPEPSRPFVEARFRIAAQGGEAEFEADCPTAKGALRRWSVNLRPLCAASGQVVSVLCTSRDVTR
ncbi:PAS domain-containing protein [Novosphingopyxis sp. YJ-S2-01]|uniref:PAS domain-containing protein n=1 Tax=Novosphingopyxis sp. YJ-S2-01 TaxID=2794021 RepID=UPI001E36C161|nr:PAS domain-containing protein [Novosphingopyxis sp. YJ-S2-01]